MARMKTAIIAGHRGQDGTLLTRLLTEKGYRVIGFDRTELRRDQTVGDTTIDLTDAAAVEKLLDEAGRSEIYYLAAYHSSSEKLTRNESMAELFRCSQAVHVTGLVNFLSAMEKLSPDSRLFYAASSLVFSGRNGETQDELTPFEPIGMYGITKAQGLWLCREFRENRKVFASGGILYNHESHLRRPSFLTAKIIRAAIRIAAGGEEKVQVGNLASRVDWGYAQDYVSAFQAILNLSEPGDYILASGVTHSVEEFINAVFDYFSLDWRNHVEVAPDLLFRQQPIKQGNAAKLERDTGITLARPFPEFVNLLIQDHLEATRLETSSCLL